VSHVPFSMCWMCVSVQMSESSGFATAMVMSLIMGMVSTITQCSLRLSCGGCLLPVVAVVRADEWGGRGLPLPW